MKYDNVSFIEYYNKKKEMLNSLDLCNGEHLCTAVRCFECPLSISKNNENLSCCDLECYKPEVALKIVMEYEPKIDWTKIPIDTKIFVKCDSDDTEWIPCHFAKFENGRVYAWNNGQTSFTISRTFSKEQCYSYMYAKLAK